MSRLVYVLNGQNLNLLVKRQSHIYGHEAGETAGGLVINPAAFTHTSVAILDVLNAIDAPVIEIHISNVHKREEFRHHSYVSSRTDAVIAGFGTQGYLLALHRMARLIDEARTT